MRIFLNSTGEVVDCVCLGYKIAPCGFYMDRWQGERFNLSFLSFFSFSGFFPFFRRFPEKSVFPTSKWSNLGFLEMGRKYDVNTQNIMICQVEVPGNEGSFEQ